MTEQTPLPLTGTGSLQYWREQITAATANISTLASQRNWDQNLQSYLGQGNRQKWGKNTTLVRKDFSLTEIKKALIFYQLPDVAATAKKPELEGAAPLVGAVVNDYLSPERTNAMAMIDEVLMDILCPAGIGVSKLGYEAFVDPNLRDVAVPNPMNPNEPALDPMTGQPVMQPNIVRETYFWNRIPPKMFLFPPSFIGSDFDQAPWVGFKYTLSKAMAESLYELAPDQLSSASSIDLQKDLLASDVTRADAQQSVSEKVSFQEIWYRAADVDPMVGDPEIIRQLVILDGSEAAPLIHRDSPYQTIQDGKMLAGMRGYPVHVFSLRYVSDQAIPPSDCSVSRDQVDELSRGRTQMIDQRDRAVPITLIDLTRLPKESQNKILRGEVQELIPVEGMDGASPPAVALQRGQWPRENFSFNDIIGRDIAEAWSLGSNQQGVDTDTRRTATELSLMQGGTDTRMGKEQARFLRQFAIGCQKLLALIQLFATDKDWARVADPNGVMVLQQWDKTAIAGEYTITLAPDSSQRVDAVAEKKRAVDIFQMFANDPLTNQQELRKMTWRKLGYDANRLVLQPQPKPPEQPNISASFSGMDLNPAAPQYVNVASLLAALGMPMAPPTPQQQAPPQLAQHPGGPPPSGPSPSGQLPGAGQAADRGLVAGG